MLKITVDVHIDEMIRAKRMTLTELARSVDITLANLSKIKTGKAKSIRFSTLSAICTALGCQPSDILTIRADEAQQSEASSRPCS